MEDMTDAVLADFRGALSTLTPKQAWAAELHEEMRREIGARLDQITHVEAQKLLKEDKLEARVEAIKQLVLAANIERESVMAADQPEDADAHLRTVLALIKETHPDLRVVETYAIGHTIFAAVRDKHHKRRNIKVMSGRIMTVQGYI